MSDDAKISITTSVDLLLPLPEESLESYLDYLETSVPGELGPRLQETFIAFIEAREDEP